MSIWTLLHPGEGDLRSYLDGELSPHRHDAIRQHLEGCGRCRHRLGQVHAAAAFAAAKLGAMHAVADVAPAPGPFQPHAQPKEVRHMSRSPLPWKVVATTAAAALALSFAFPGVRAMASEWITIFRVQQAQVIRINPADFQAANFQPKAGMPAIPAEMLGQLVQVEEITKAVQQSGLSIKEATARGYKQPRFLPEGYAPVQGVFSNSGEQLVRFDVDAINGFLALAGSKATLPAELKGQAIRVREGHLVAFRYKNGDQELSIMQGATPELSASGSVNLKELVNSLVSTLGEEFGLPLSLRSQLAAMDLSRTLPLPIVEGEGGAEIKVNGHVGTYYEEGGRGLVLWVSGERMMAVHGSLPRAELIRIAESLEG